MNDDDKLDERELSTDDALLLSDDASERSSVDSDEASELPADDALLPSEDARELKSLDKLFSELVLSLFEPFEHAGKPKKTTAATIPPTIATRERRSIPLF